jgi:diguanylate cyclase (GGDEF)-like protein/PAS domain S-box-containing protein
MHSSIDSDTSLVLNDSSDRLNGVSGAVQSALRRSLEAYVLFPMFAAILLLFAWTTILHQITLERAAAENAAMELSRQMADTYEAQMARNAVAIDQVLKTVKYEYETRRGVTLSELQGHGLLPYAIVFKVAIAGSDGRLLDATRPQAPISVASQSYFTVQRNRAADDPSPFVGQVVGNATTGAPEITFSRRLTNIRGDFAGIVMLSVDPTYFTKGYEQSRMGNEGMLAVLGTDGVMRAERVGTGISWGRVVSTEQIYAGEAWSDGAKVQAWDQRVQRYTNVRVLNGIPLIAIVGLGQDEQLVQFRRHERLYLYWGAGGSTALLLLAFVLSRSSWQLSISRQRAKRARQTYYAASEASLDAFFVFRTEYGTNGEIVGFIMLDTNKRAVEVSGLSRNQLIGRTLAATFPNSGGDGMFDDFAHVAQTGLVREHEWMHQRPDGSWVWLHRQVVRVEEGVVAILRDISLRKHAELRRADQNRVLEMIATSTPLADVLSYMARLLESQIEGAACAALLLDDDGQHLAIGAAPSLPERYSTQTHGSQIGPDAGPSGRAIYLRQPVYISDADQDKRLRSQLDSCEMFDRVACWALPILSHDGRALGSLTFFLRTTNEPTVLEAQTIAMATRITGIAIERSQAEARIRHLATHDALTGLPNRALLSDRLNQVLLHAQRFQRGVTVVFIDLDNFKLINDSLGHRAGDELLKTMADRMTRCVRPTDTVVRLGGDEFVIVLFDQEQNDDGITTTINTIREAILDPVALVGQDYQVTCSMGVASYPDDGTDAETLLQNADAAMYRAKEMGRNNHQFYTAEMNVKAHEKLRLQEQLRRAVTNNEFRLVYQPQVDLKTERIFGVEALLRWDHPTDGLIAPTTFIPLAEQTGLILPIGDWVLRTACSQNKAWQEAGFCPMTVSVNVSARQFLQKDLVHRVANALAESGLDAQYLELELTESVIMQDLVGAIATMKELQEMGVGLSIDDFGTGYSSLSALKHFPITRLKIDQSFVRDLPGGIDDRAIALAVISLGRQLNLQVIAEGVETEKQLDFLRDNDCNEIQGYHYSKPVSPVELERLLQGPFVWPSDGLIEHGSAQLRER